MNGTFTRAVDGAVNSGDAIKYRRGEAASIPAFCCAWSPSSRRFSTVDGAGQLPVGHLWHRHHRAPSRCCSSTPRSASNGEPIPTRPISLGSARVPCAATHLGSPCALADDGAAPSWARHCPSYAPSLLSTRVRSCAYRNKLAGCPRVDRVPRNAARVRSPGVRCTRVMLCSRRVLRAVCPCSASRYRSKC